MSQTSSVVPPAAGGGPTVVLVHGAFAESSSWNGVIARLLARDYPVVAAANPLRGVKVDTDYIAGLIASIPGPIVLVGHSYGGIVITNAVRGNPNVRALVYVAGYAPDTGESAADLSGRYPGGTLAQTLATVPLPDGGNDLYIRQDMYWAQFAADLPEAESKLMGAAQRPVTEAALYEASDANVPGWKTVPSWFIYGELDKNIPAAAHAFMAERAGSRATVAVPGASHVVGISHPDAVADMILAAAESVVAPESLVGTAGSVA